MKGGETLDTEYHSDYKNPFPRPENNIVIFREVPILVPTLSSISPRKVVEGTKGLTVTVKGKYFLRTSIVRANWINLPTEFVNVMELRARVPDEITAQPGVYSFTVTTPSLGSSDPNLNNTLLLVTFKDPSNAVGA